ncbi:MAG: DUF1189 domain-containing protein [Alphaproteobacteria bacterium]|nr:DUF1189 domain-containing protein [Alphaproteobacteria bacterium]
MEYSNTPNGEVKYYPFITALWNGFFNREFYMHVATRWRGQGFLYLVVIALLVTLPIIFELQTGMKTFYDKELPYMLEQMPDISIQDGKASSVAGEPVQIYSTDGTSEIMIDTQGVYETPADAKVRILVGEEFVMVQRNEAEMRSYKFTDMGNMMLTAPMINQWAEKLRPWAVFATFAALSIVFYLWLLVVMLFYSLFGMLIAKLLKMDIAYGAILQICIIAIGCKVIIEFFVSVAGFFLWGWIAFAITLGFIGFGLKAVRDWVKNHPPQPDIQ